MNRKGVVTIFEMALLAILTVAFILVYIVTAGQSQQDILIKVLGTEQQQSHNLVLLSVYRDDYVRYKPGAVFEGSFADMKDYYGRGFPIKFTYSSKGTMERMFNVTITEGSVGDYTLYLFDPYEMLTQGNPFYPVGVRNANQ